MDIVTVQEIVDRWGEGMVRVWLDQDADAPLATDRIDEARQATESEILGYLSAHYSLPLVSIPPVLRNCALEMVPYYLATGSAMSEEIQDRYNSKVRMLVLISKGDVRLGVPHTQAPSEAEDTYYHDPGTFAEVGKLGGRNIF